MLTRSGNPGFIGQVIAALPRLYLIPLGLPFRKGLRAESILSAGP
jgi:hypothetical protein